MRLFTIGFTQKTAERFFTLLQGSGVRRVLDTRLNNRSQLAGFSKVDDLPYLLKAIAQIDYRHATEFAPTQEILDAFKKRKGSWSDYEAAYFSLLAARGVSDTLQPLELDSACLLCSEHAPTYCHRRLAAEHLSHRFPSVEIVHLL